MSAQAAVAGMSSRTNRARTASGVRGLHADVVSGLRWLRDAPAVRTLVLTILTFNITWAMGWGILVLWAQERVGLGPVGFGLLTCDNDAQALDRAGLADSTEDKGHEAATAAVATARTLRDWATTAGER